MNCIILNNNINIINIYAKKTKILIVDKHNKKMEITISLHDMAVEEVKLFCYLDNYITQENKYTTEIKSRVALAKQCIL